MRLLLLLTLFVSFPAWAKFAPCDALLDPREAELAMIVGRMADLKEEPATSSVMDEIDSLNMRALEIVSARLTEIGVKHHISYFDRFREPGFYSGQDRRYLEQRRDQLSQDAADAQLKAVLEKNLRVRVGYEALYFRAMQELNEINTKLLVPARPLLEVPVLQVAFAKPFIQIDADPEHPELLREVAERFPSVVMMISPQQKSHVAHVLASVAGLTLFQSPEQVFAPDFGRQQSLRHEITHIEHYYALVEGENELPYNLEIVARKDEKIPGAPKAYDEFMHFGELDTWSNDVQHLLDTRDEDYIPMRLHKNGTVFLQHNRLEAAFDKMRTLATMILLAGTVVDELEESLLHNAQDFTFDYSERAYAAVSIPWRAPDGREIADIHIQLKGLTEEAQAERFLYLARYLTAVKERVGQHRRQLMVLMTSVKEQAVRAESAAAAVEPAN